MPGAHVISYFYWTAFKPPDWITTMMNAFQGYGGPVKSVWIQQFHPPNMGMNELRTDGSVDFGYANLASP